MKRITSEQEFQDLFNACEPFGLKSMPAIHGAQNNDSYCEHSAIANLIVYLDKKCAEDEKEKVLLMTINQDIKETVIYVHRVLIPYGGLETVSHQVENVITALEFFIDRCAYLELLTATIDNKENEIFKNEVDNERLKNEVAELSADILKIANSKTQLEETIRFQSQTLQQMQNTLRDKASASASKAKANELFDAFERKHNIQRGKKPAMLNMVESDTDHVIADDGMWAEVPRTIDKNLFIGDEKVSIQEHLQLAGLLESKDAQIDSLLSALDNCMNVIRAFNRFK